jgi:hypothetical protein
MLITISIYLFLSVPCPLSVVGVHNTEYHVDEDVSVGNHSPNKPPPDEKNSPVQKKPERRRTLSTKNSLGGMPSIGSREDLSMSESSVSPPINGRMAVSRIVGPEAYYMGIVDFQQQYDFSKKMERFFKVQIQGKSSPGLSCIEPVTYRQRFLRRMEELVDFDMDELDLPTNKSGDSSILEEDEEV